MTPHRDKCFIPIWCLPYVKEYLFVIHPFRTYAYLNPSCFLLYCSCNTLISHYLPEPFLCLRLRFLPAAAHKETFWLSGCYLGKILNFIRKKLKVKNLYYNEKALKKTPKNNRDHNRHGRKEYSFTNVRKSLHRQ